MPSRFVFRCEVCDSEPDEETQRTLTSQLAELRSGEYVNAPPGGWLVWHGNGIYGPLGATPAASGRYSGGV
ncbi:MAG TPA: hypothetical protein VIM03_12785 [Thermoleophilaceae bacterium]